MGQSASQGWYYWREGRQPSPQIRRQQVKIVILGCGRVGATLANMMDRAGHQVSVIDYSSEAFQRLDPDFKGETILGNGVDEDILIRAGIKDADAFAAVTNGDNRNIMASQIAKEIFHVKKVVCRIYDPIRERTYHELGLETFCPTTIGAQMLAEALLGEPAAAKAAQQDEKQ
ncbi:TrkA family potassium uptake protein [Thermogemmatispora carboxidivorans]|uniref:potassium channel family protein n=1 Tax=Thermogemmatispora carboxidivorans TaxID=1382306 RepID=UPI00307CAE83